MQGEADSRIGLDEQERNAVQTLDTRCSVDCGRAVSRYCDSQYQCRCLSIHLGLDV